MTIEQVFAALKRKIANAVNIEELTKSFDEKYAAKKDTVITGSFCQNSGTDSKNIHTVDQKGNAEFAGDVIAKGCGGEVPISLESVSEKVVALEEKWGSIVDGNEVAY